MSKHLKTPQQVRAEFEAAGVTVSDWSLQNGFPMHVVYRVLNGGGTSRGMAHRVAVALKIKDGRLADVADFYPAPAQQAQARRITKKIGVAA